MSLSFKRVYVDVPSETHTALKVKAVELGMSMKALLAKLIEDACNNPKPKRSNTNGSKKKQSKKR